MLTTPALIVVAPVYVLAPERISVPVLVLVSPPAPAAIPPYVSVVAAATSIVPVDVKAIPRLELSVNVAVVERVPPLNVSCPGVAAPGAAPSLLSAAMVTTPALIVVAP